MDIPNWTLIRFTISASMLALLFSAPCSAQDATGIKNLKDADLELMNNHDPNSELTNFELLDGYQVNLFASEPMFANPIHMHWDSKGRLWVACSWAYPQLKPGEVPNDKIIILEDTDKDGVADKSTVFADGLYLPTGLELANGGCYVAQSPDVFFFKDTDGDDVADVKELALTGFGIEDSHHSISAWRRGPGGWIYFQEGIFLHSQVETQHGVIRNFNGGVYQFNPRSQELRVFCKGTGGNPWGHVFDRWGQSFMVNNPRIMYLSPASGNSGQTVRVKPLISTEKQCGGDLATGTHVGDDIQGNLLSGRFKSRTVIRYELIEQGAGFSANVLEPLISSKHPNFRPVDVKIGPDGAVYVADWYNSIINHAQHDFRDPRRDHEHGRIWRITHKERPLAKRPELDGIPVPALVEHLKSPETWTRHQARKELSERDPDEVLAELERWVNCLDQSDTEYDHHLVEAMWACQNVERVSEEILTLVLSAKDGHARSAGARIIRYWHNELSDPVEMVAKACDDAFPRTRMEAILSAGYIPKAEAYAAAIRSIDHESDPFLDQALPQTKMALERYWGPALEQGTLRFEKDSHRKHAEQDSGMGFSMRLDTFLDERNPPDKEIAAICEHLRTAGTEENFASVFSALSSRRGIKSEAAAIALLQELKTVGRAKRSDSMKKHGRGLKRLLKNPNETVVVLAVENLGAWGIDEGLVELSTIVANAKQSPALRRSAAVALAKLTGKEGLETLLTHSKSSDRETQFAASQGIISADLNRGIPLAAQLLVDDPETADPVPLILAIVGQRNGSKRLAQTLQDIKIHPSAMTKISDFHRSSGFLPSELLPFFLPSSSEKSLNDSLLGEDSAKLVSDVEAFGDAARGEDVYRMKALSCVNCHSIGPAGPQIGPNLVAVGAAAKTAYIVESILQPTKAIAEHYENQLFLLDDGTTQSGIVTFKSENEIVVRDATLAGKEVRLDVDEIVAEKSLRSAMPDRLVDQLTSRQEFLDLAKFVSVLGKPGAYGNDETPVIRKWRVSSSSSDASPTDDETDWLPAYSRVSGELPHEDYPPGKVVFARGFINVLVPGPVRLKLNSTVGLKLSINGKPVPDLASPIHLNQGRQTLTFKIDPALRKAGLRVEPSSTDGIGKFQPEGGP